MAEKKPSYPPPYPEGTPVDEPAVVEYPKHVKDADGTTVTVNSKEEEATVKAGAKKAEKAEKDDAKAADPNEPRFGGPKK